MDDFVGLIVALVVLVALAAMLVMPIIAVVISIRTKKKLARDISRLENTQFQSQTSSSPPTSLVEIVRQLPVRFGKLEAALKDRSFVAAEIDRPVTEQQHEPKPVATPLEPPLQEPPKSEPLPPLTIEESARQASPTLAATLPDRKVQ